MTLISVCIIVFSVTLHVLQCMGLALCASIHGTGCMIEYEWQYEHNNCIIAESKFDQSIGIVYVAYNIYIWTEEMI